MVVEQLAFRVKLPDSRPENRFVLALSAGLFSTGNSQCDFGFHFSP